MSKQSKAPSSDCSSSIEIRASRSRRSRSRSTRCSQSTAIRPNVLPIDDTLSRDCSTDRTRLQSRLRLSRSTRQSRGCRLAPPAPWEGGGANRIPMGRLVSALCYGNATTSLRVSHPVRESLVNCGRRAACHVGARHRAVAPARSAGGRRFGNGARASARRRGRNRRWSRPWRAR